MKFGEQSEALAALLQFARGAGDDGVRFKRLPGEFVESLLVISDLLREVGGRRGTG